MDNTPTPPNNFLNWVEIKNFKSIKDLRLDCKRVNVFIGKPNVGKSNILEALGLLGGDYGSVRFLAGMVRYEDIKHLFFDNYLNETIFVTSDKTSAQLTKNPEAKISNREYSYVLSEGYTTPSGIDITGPTVAHNIDNTGQIIDTSEFTKQVGSVKKYDFANLTEFQSDFPLYLLPSNGPNLYAVIRRNKDLRAEFSKLFSKQSLELVLYDEKNEFIIQKRNSDIVYQYPFFSIADTFRRYMFYVTAIESNKDSVIVFEEPEVHSFPPYTKSLAHRIASSETNQFFIATHSPYLLNTLIDELDEADLSVFITYYQDYQTHVRALSADELLEARDLGIDLFYNLSRYEPNA